MVMKMMTLEQRVINDNKNIFNRRRDATALCSIASYMSFMDLTPETYDVESKCPEGISKARWRNMVKRFWKEQYNGR